MLDPILDPLYGAAGNASGDTHQHDVRKYALLDTEAAAGVRRRAQTQTVAWHFQRARHNGMQAERSHEIGEHVVGVFTRIVFGDNAVSFDRCAGVARVTNRHRYALRGLRKGMLRVAITKRAFTSDVRAE